MELTVEIEEWQDGRSSSVTVPVPITPEGFVRRVTLICPEGVLASIPLAMWHGGPPWPPLPFDDWSAISDAYLAKVQEVLDAVPGLGAIGSPGPIPDASS